MTSPRPVDQSIDVVDEENTEYNGDEFAANVSELLTDTPLEYEVEPNQYGATVLVSAPTTSTDPADTSEGFENLSVNTNGSGDFGLALQLKLQEFDLNELKNVGKFLDEVESFSEEKGYRALSAFLNDVKELILSNEASLDVWKALWTPIVKRVVDQQFKPNIKWITQLGRMIDECYHNDLEQWRTTRAEFLHVVLTIYVNETTEITVDNVKGHAEIYEYLLNLQPSDIISEAMLKRGEQSLISSIAFNKRNDILNFLIQATPSMDRRNTQPRDPLHQGDNKELLRELNAGSIPQSTIILLNKLLNMYVTPDGEDGARKHALVFYNVEDRKDENHADFLPQQTQDEADVDVGSNNEQKNRLTDEECLRKTKEALNQSEMEADTVLWWMHDAKFVYDGIRDWTQDKLLIQLEELVEKVKDDCSVLVVFLMAHGEEGHVFDVNGSKVSLDALHDIINSIIPDGIPKLFIVQSCQVEKSSAPEQAEEIPSEESFFSKLLSPFGLRSAKAEAPAVKKARIPNRQNFVRVMAAAGGQEAYRNEFLPLLIDELRKGRDLMKAVSDTAKECKQTRLH